jgi:hypothetical protein
MSFNPSSPTQEPIDVDALTPMAQADAGQVRRESSEDSTPIVKVRHRREPVKEREGSPERRVTRQVKRTSPIRKTIKPKKGPTAWAAKPIMKNDMKAKKAVIKEIEHLWGKNFIKHYIPKCHRPLVKRGKHSKRSMYRSHETDPKKWLPSVLKAILMIAKLTNNKNWLSKAMNDVVRYRIKNTGNRKPQLVTTDFDVIEDILVKDWKVEYAFEIRYKHLLVNRKDQQEDDADIDHILQAGSDRDSNGEASGNDSNSDEEMDEASDEPGSDSDTDVADQRDGGGVSGNYQQASGYTNKGAYHPQHLSPSLPREKKHKSNKKAEIKAKIKAESPGPILPLHQYQGMYGYGSPMPGYGPPVDQQGRPMMQDFGGYGGSNGGWGGYGGFNGFGGGYGGFPGYGGPQMTKDGRQDSMFPPHHGMNHMMTPSPSIPDFERRGRGSGGTEFPKIKRESPGPAGFDGHNTFVEDPEAMVEDIAEDDDEDPEAAELAALELELKIRKLKAKKAKMARK